MNEETMTF